MLSFSFPFFFVYKGMGDRAFAWVNGVPVIGALRLSVVTPGYGHDVHSR